MLAEDLLRPSNVHVLRGLVQLGRLRAANTDMKGCMKAVHVFHTYVFVALHSVLICIHMRCGKETYLQSHLLHLFSWLFSSCTVAGMTADLPSPHRPVRLLARSQPSTFQVSLACVFPSCFPSSSFPFPWFIRSQHFPQYVFAISPHHMPVPVHASLGDLFINLRHSLIVPWMCSFMFMSLHFTPHIHHCILYNHVCCSIGLCNAAVSSCW